MAINWRQLLRRSPVGYNVIFEDSVSTVVEDLDIAAIYRTQANVRSVVSFLADNIAELPLKVYRRNGDTDRERVTSGPVFETFKRPNRAMTKFELIRATVSTALLYDRVVWMIAPDTDGKMEIIPIPTPWLVKDTGTNALQPDSILIRNKNGSEAIEVPSSMFVMFHGYNPEGISSCSSPLRALRQTIYEQEQADKYRASVWRNGGRISAYISRPANIQPWTPEQAERFKTDFRAAWTGNGPRAGGMPVLEDGMTIQSLSFNAKEAQWAEAKQISREEAAAIYHVNPSLIWHTGTQTYASAKDNARALYSETMGPYMEFLTERINTFVLPMLGAEPDEYVEFDLMKKLAGSFEEQASVLTSAVGAPWMTRDEARARQNLPAIDGGSELIVPLNVAVGGAGYVDQYQNSVEPETKMALLNADPIRIKAHPLDEDFAEYVEIMRNFMQRQARTVVSALGAGKPEWWDAERWDRELSEDLLKTALETSERTAKQTLRRIDVPADAYSVERTEHYLEAMATRRAHNVNQRTYQELTAAYDESEAEDTSTAQKVFDAAEDRATKSGRSMAAAVAGFAVLEAVRQASADGYPTAQVTKTWRVTSGDPRPSHAAMDGETVLMDEKFSNGADYPGDTEALDAADVCNCMCECEITIP